MIAFRADGNGEVGMGHVMRCLAIATELEAMGEECVFIAADRAASEQVEAAGFPLVVLGSDPRRLASELPALGALLSGTEVDLLVVDSYFADDGYLAAARELVPLAYVDDFARSRRPVDLVACFNPACAQGGLARLYVGTGTEVVSGIQFFPLRREFRGRAPREARAEVSEALVLTGGADVSGLAAPLAAALCSETEARVTVVAGPLSACGGDLRDLSRANDRVAVLGGVGEMGALMERCDLAVSSSGTTLLELCACGTPTVAYAEADNQVAGVVRLSALGAVSYAGDIRAEGVTPGAIARMASSLARSRSSREEMGRVGQSLVDGRGALRLARELARFSRKGGAPVISMASRRAR